MLRAKFGDNPQPKQCLAVWIVSSSFRNRDANSLPNLKELKRKGFLVLFDYFILEIDSH